MSTDDNNQSKATIKMLVETELAEEESEVSTAPGIAADRPVTDFNGTRAVKGINKVDIVDRLASINMLVPGSHLGQQFQDQYRRIKRPLLSNAFGKTASLVDNGNLILVTSSIPDEGKTFTAVNLALSISQEKDKTVLIVDCDAARQGTSRLLGIDHMVGMVDVLEDAKMTVGDALIQTDIANLRALSAGKHDEYVTEMLSSLRMSELIDELVNRYSDRVIVIDGPPLLSTPQAPILAGLVGQVVFVVEAGKTSQTLVEDAIELIPEGKATGIVMNKNQGLSLGGGDYYGYYGYGRADEDKAK